MLYEFLLYNKVNQLYIYTYKHSSLDSFPIYVIMEYWLEFPVLYSRPLLFYIIYYNIKLYNILLYNLYYIILL